MKSEDVLWNALVIDGVTQQQMAERLGYKSHAAITNAMSRKTGMRMDLFVRIMNELGYEIVARRSDGEFIVTDS